jgi:hypothetical protein
MSVVLPGCSTFLRPPADLHRYPQQVAPLLDPATSQQRLITPELQALLNADYDRRFFEPWQTLSSPLPAETVFWGVAEYGAKIGYGQDLQPWTPDALQALIFAQQIDHYPLLDRTAIAIRNTDLRVMPTRHPFFFNPAKAGEGYPFDYFQNSAISTGTPLRVTHRSVDGAWYLVEAGHVFGWLTADVLAWTDAELHTAYQTGRYAAICQDHQILTGADGEFLAEAHIGNIFPTTGTDATGHQLLVPVRDADGQARLRTATLPSTSAIDKPLPLTAAALATVADGMMGQPYGWGGLNQDRDCSALLRDLFAPFGIWLPRNSAEQARQAGNLVVVDDLSVQQKQEVLKTQGRPFTTLVWFPGHIGLYLGLSPDDGQPLLFHALWGVRTTNWFGESGRQIVGRVVVTSVQPGAELPGASAQGLWTRMRGFTLLPRDLSEFLVGPQPPKL